MKHHRILYAITFLSLSIAIASILMQLARVPSTSDLNKSSSNELRVGDGGIPAMWIQTRPTVLNGSIKTHSPCLELLDTHTCRIVASFEYDQLFGASISLHSVSGNGWMRLGFDGTDQPCILLTRNGQHEKFLLREEGDRLVLIRE